MWFTPPPDVAVYDFTVAIIAFLKNWSVHFRQRSEPIAEL
jgi:hypothetical protein